MLALVGVSMVAHRANSQAPAPLPVDADAGVAPTEDDDGADDSGGGDLPKVPADPTARRG
ncbi:MAG: hypothetical protein R3B06_17345 [Kofleriaceae bacterium]